MKGFHGITEERVRERAGKSCEESYRILGECGAREKGHTRCNRFLPRHSFQPRSRLIHVANASTTSRTASERARSAC